MESKKNKLSITSNFEKYNSDKMNNDIAVIGMALSFPCAKTISAYESILNDGIECIHEYPEKRKEFAVKYLKLKNVKKENMEFRKGGFLDDINEFDYKYFGIPPREAELMDPHQRLFLQIAVEAIEDAGYSKQELRGSKTGVFVGYSPNTELYEYRQMIVDLEYDRIAMSIPGNLNAIIPSRVSYLLDLKGPSILVDTTCSSSLSAIHLACKSLQTGECDLALVGGARLTLFPLRGVGEFGIESSDDHTRPFDNLADGTGTGEGVAVVVLKPLAKAVYDGDDIYAIIKGSAMNQDGSSSNIIAPNEDSQKEVMVQAWKNAGINPETISYIEAHGTATKLGDPIEAESIVKAFKEFTDRQYFCGIGSVKSNFGHLFAASGMAGFIKCVLSLKNKLLYPTINFRQLNKNIDFTNSALYVNTELKHWEKYNGVRRCGINGFGVSGTNCHIILEESPLFERKEITLPKQLITFSAQSEECLYSLLSQYVEYLTKHSLNINDVCYVVNTSRDSFNYRLALIVDSVDDLIAKLSKILEIRSFNDIDNVFYNQVSAYVEDNENTHIVNILQELKKCIQDGCSDINLLHRINEDLCNLYISGFSIPWENFYHFLGAHKVHLPAMCFEKYQCCINIPDVLPKSNLFDRIITNGVVSYDNEIETEPKYGVFENDDLSLENVKSGLIDIWKDVLGYSIIDVDDNFYELGGDSISLMQITDEISNLFKVDISMSYFTSHATINELSHFIFDNINKTQEKIYKERVSEPEKLYEPFGITDIQAAYLVGRDANFELGGLGTHIYSEIETKLDIPKLNVALNNLIKRHPMLRARFIPETQQQIILKDVPQYVIKYQDISMLDANEQQSIILKERNRMSHYVFDPSKWPLFELTALKLGDDKNYLFFGYDMLIADGLSIGIFTEEIAAFYNNRELPPIDFTFRDYIQAYVDFKESKTYHRDKQYHLDRIDTLPLGPSLLLKDSPSNIKKPFFARKEKFFTVERWLKLKQTAQSNHVTPTALLCTAYATMLNTWSSEHSFTINLTVFNRYPFNKDINKLIGDFTSVILLDFDFNKNRTILELMKIVQTNLLEKLEHRHFEGVSVIRELVKRRGLGSRAIMPVVFTSMLFDDKMKGEDVTDSIGNMVFGASQTSQVFLDNQITEVNGQLHITWDYVKDLFDDNVIDQMFEQYLTIIDNLIDGVENYIPNISDSDLSMISKYNDTEEQFNYQTLDCLFREKAKEYPDKLCIVSDEQSYTYKDLDKISNQIAHFLLESKVQPGECVAVVVDRKAITIANILGILKAGGAYIPIDPHYPEDRIEYIMNHSNSRIILKNDTYLSERISQYSDEDFDTISDLESLAYIIFTSGSTGVPKGVMISHKAVVNTIFDINKKFNINENDRIIGLSSMCFDLSVYDIFGCLLSGATLYMVPNIKDTDKIGDIIVKNKITFWNSVPSVMHLFIENQIYKNKSTINVFDSVKHVLLSGDWIPLDLPEKINKYLPNAKIISLGGATEASIWSIYYPINGIEPNWKSIPYGYPLANQKFYVLSNDMSFCPIGVEGELYIGGVGVALGYLNDIEKTENSFIKHPSLGYIYRTGDYGILHKEGYIEFRGRKDDQVKIRGNRIELGEIDAQLLQNEDVSQVVTLVKEIAPNDKKIISYVTPSYKNVSPVLRTHYEGTAVLKTSLLEVPMIISDISNLGMTLHGSLNLDKIDFSTNFILCMDSECLSCIGKLISLGDNFYFFAFNDLDNLSKYANWLIKYRSLLDFDTFVNSTLQFDLRLVDICSIKYLNGNILTNNQIRTLTAESISIWKDVDNNVKYGDDVQLIFKLSGYDKELVCQAECCFVDDEICIFKFINSSTEVISLLLHYYNFTGVSSSILRRYLEDKLPDYMIPFNFVVLERMPLTSNQKVDRKKLPNPILKKQDELIDESIRPKDPIEEKVIDIWKEILKIENIKCTDNFFELGGDSLQVYQIVMRVEAEFKVKIPIEVLYREPNVPSVSRYIKNKLQKSQLSTDESKNNIADSDIKLYWSPNAHWKIQNSCLYINSDQYDCISLFPKLYYLTQEGISINNLHKEFSDPMLSSYIDDLCKNRILISHLPSWHEVYTPYFSVFDNKYEEDTFLNKEKYKAFKREQMERLVKVEDSYISLELLTNNLPKSILERQSYRNFDENKLIDFTMFSTLLSVLKQTKTDDNYHYFYSSAGGLYPLDIYLYIKGNRVENVSEGLYYYHPVSHKLYLVSKNKIDENSTYAKNKNIFLSSALTMYIVYNANASMPIYGSDAYYYASIDTGILVATLTQVCESLNLGLCSIGDMNFDHIKDCFGLSENQIFMHSIEIGIKPSVALTFDEVTQKYIQNK